MACAGFQKSGEQVSIPLTVIKFSARFARLDCYFANFFPDWVHFPEFLTKQGEGARAPLPLRTPLLKTVTLNSGDF